MRVAVVTGGSSGIGRAVGERLSRLGWRCVLLARGRERLEATAGELGADAEVCDVGDRDAVDAVATRVAERHERIGLLVNNAGIPARGSFFDLSAERIEEVTRTNYLGSVWATRAFLPLLERGAPAHVVNVVSVAGTVAYGPSGPYAAAKHAQIAFSRNAAVELRRRGIRVHTILPGPVQTDGFPQRDLLASPLSRRVVVSPERVADAVVRAVENDRTETFVPAGWRAAALAAAIAPGTMARLAAHRRVRR